MSRKYIGPRNKKGNRPFVSTSHEGFGHGPRDKRVYRENRGGFGTATRRRYDSTKGRYVK
ncbi:MAG: hypothetical protein HY435_01605 [Candidatus Liptonbacteria bacterium]|nr:hypothetical protein [Candidatus Liptonbacteria bacterium]